MNIKPPSNNRYSSFAQNSGQGNSVQNTITQQLKADGIANVTVSQIEKKEGAFVLTVNTKDNKSTKEYTLTFNSNNKSYEITDGKDPKYNSRINQLNNKQHLLQTIYLRLEKEFINPNQTFTGSNTSLGPENLINPNAYSGKDSAALTQLATDAIEEDQAQSFDQIKKSIIDNLEKNYFTPKGLSLLNIKYENENTFYFNVNSSHKDASPKKWILVKKPDGTIRLSSTSSQTGKIKNDSSGRTTKFDANDLSGIFATISDGMSEFRQNATYSTPLAPYFGEEFSQGKIRFMPNDKIYEISCTHNQKDTTIIMNEDGTIIDNNEFKISQEDGQALIKSIFPMYKKLDNGETFNPTEHRVLSRFPKETKLCSMIESRLKTNNNDAFEGYTVELVSRNPETGSLFIELKGDEKNPSKTIELSESDHFLPKNNKKFVMRTRYKNLTDRVRSFFQPKPRAENMLALYKDINSQFNQESTAVRSLYQKCRDIFRSILSATIPEKSTFTSPNKSLNRLIEIENRIKNQDHLKPALTIINILKENKDIKEEDIDEVLKSITFSNYENQIENLQYDKDITSLMENYRTKINDFFKNEHVFIDGYLSLVDYILGEKPTEENPQPENQLHIAKSFLTDQLLKFHSPLLLPLDKELRSILQDYYKTLSESLTEELNTDSSNLSEDEEDDIKKRLYASISTVTTPTISSNDFMSLSLENAKEACLKIVKYLEHETTDTQPQISTDTLTKGQEFVDSFLDQADKALSLINDFNKQQSISTKFLPNDVKRFKELVNQLKDTKNTLEKKLTITVTIKELLSDPDSVVFDNIDAALLFDFQQNVKSQQSILTKNGSDDKPSINETELMKPYSDSWNEILSSIKNRNNVFNTLVDDLFNRANTTLDENILESFLSNHDDHITYLSKEERELTATEKLKIYLKRKSANEDISNDLNQLATFFADSAAFNQLDEKNQLLFSTILNSIPAGPEIRSLTTISIKPRDSEDKSLENSSINSGHTTVESFSDNKSVISDLTTDQPMEEANSLYNIFKEADITVLSMNYNTDDKTTPPTIELTVETKRRGQGPNQKTYKLVKENNNVTLIDPEKQETVFKSFNRTSRVDQFNKNLELKDRAFELFDATIVNLKQVNGTLEFKATEEQTRNDKKQTRNFIVAAFSKTNKPFTNKTDPYRQLNVNDYQGLVKTRSFSDPNVLKGILSAKDVENIRQKDGQNIIYINEEKPNHLYFKLNDGKFRFFPVILNDDEINKNYTDTQAELQNKFPELFKEFGTETLTHALYSENFDNEKNVCQNYFDEFDNTLEKMSKMFLIDSFEQTYQANPELKYNDIVEKFPNAYFFFNQYNQ